MSAPAAAPMPGCSVGVPGRLAENPSSVNVCQPPALTGMPVPGMRVPGFGGVLEDELLLLAVSGFLSSLPEISQIVRPTMAPSASRPPPISAIIAPEPPLWFLFFFFFGW